MLAEPGATLSQFAEAMIECKSQSYEEVIEMEDPRCRIAAIAMDDPRCKGLLSGVVIEMEDPRCKSLFYRVVLEMEDPRCNRVTIEMEDPRCRGLSMTW
jgi:hypothetical protein